MANRSLHPLLHYLRRLKSGQAGDRALADAQLLHRFLTERDESAFTTLVQRYGAMVWGLCVRRLGETPEAEDAFQATFLVLVKKAASLRGPQLLGPWLYGVAYRTAMKLRGQRARRAARETPLPAQIAEERREAIDSDLLRILDEEIQGLPTKYRLPVLLCYVQGMSSEEAAQRLGCAKGTIFSRLSRARDRLRRRLAHRGVEVSAGALAAVLAENAVLRAAPSLVLREMTIRTSLLLAAGTAGPTLSAPLAALVEGVVRSMFLSKVKFVAVVVLAVGLAGSGAGFLAHHTRASPPSSPSLPPVNQEKGRVEAVADNAELAAPAPARPKPSDPIDPDENMRLLRQQLSQSVDYPGLDDARATLADALDHLSKRYSIPFHANEQVFRAIDPKIEVLGFKIGEKTIPPMRAPLKTVLQTILERLPTKMGALYVIRKEYIEITTEAAVRAELGIPANRPLLPLVWETLANTPIKVALRRLALQSGYNIVVDPRIADKVQTSATAELNNVPIDTAVRVLANMAGMSMVRLDNVLYVTTVDNAKKLREEQAKINADVPAKCAEAPKKSATDKPAK